MYDLLQIDSWSMYFNYALEVCTWSKSYVLLIYTSILLLPIKIVVVGIGSSNIS